MRTSIPPRKKSSQPAPIVARPMKTTRVLTRTSSPVPTPMWLKSMTRHTRAVEATRKWRMRTMGKAARMRERWSPRRRRPKQRSDGQSKRCSNRVSAFMHRGGVTGLYSRKLKPWRPRSLPLISRAIEYPSDWKIQPNPSNPIQSNSKQSQCNSIQFNSNQSCQLRKRKQKRKCRPSTLPYSRRSLRPKSIPPELHVDLRTSFSFSPRPPTMSSRGYLIHGTIHHRDIL